MSKYLSCALRLERNEYLSDDDDDDDVVEKFEATPGTAVVEVFNMIYLGKDEIKPEKQLGTIEFHTYPGFDYLYKVDKVDLRKPSIQYGDVIALNVKKPSFHFNDDVVRMKYDLFCGAFKGVLNIPTDFLEYRISLSRVLLNSRDYTGQILVNLGTFPNATIANVEIKLVNNSAPVNISGAIYASNANLHSSNAASLLFHQKPDNGIIVGLDGIIPLSKSFVGVPLHSRLYVEMFLIINGVSHTDVLSFDVKETAPPDKIFTTTDRKIKILVNVTWGDFQHCKLISQENNTLSVVDQRTLSVSRSGRIMSGRVAEGNFHLQYAWFMETINGEPSYIISNVTIAFLSWLCTAEVHSRPELVKILHPAVLFNLIQVAHRFQMKSVMDLACRTLAVKIKTKAFEEIKEEFSMHGFYIRTRKHIESIAYSEEFVKKSLKDLKETIKLRRMNLYSILRQRGKEALINKSHLVDVTIYPFARERLPLVIERNSVFKRCLIDFLEESKKSQPRNLDKLLEATSWLNNLTAGDLGYANCLGSTAVSRLIQIVAEIYIYKDRSSEVVSIQIMAVRVLSRAVSCRNYYVHVKDAVPVLVKVMSEPLLEFNLEGVIALTHLAYAYPDCISVIFENDALEKAHQIATNIKHENYEALSCVAKFFAVVCSTYCPEDKLKVALAISEILFETAVSSDYHSVISACYALQYLTYGRSVESGELWNKIIRRLVGVICNCFPVGNNAATTVESSVRGVAEVAGSVLGVIGNIARWGHIDQIKILTRDKGSQLVQCLGKILCCGSKTFSEEACQIISNLAAQGETRIPEMREAKLIEPLCSLLETDMYDSDVKMEAAWAVFNGIYGDNYRAMDMYPRDGDGMRPYPVCGIDNELNQCFYMLSKVCEVVFKIKHLLCVTAVMLYLLRIACLS